MRVSECTSECMYECSAVMTPHPPSLCVEASYAARVLSHARCVCFIARHTRSQQCEAVSGRSVDGMRRKHMNLSLFVRTDARHGRVDTTTTTHTRVSSQPR